MGGRQTLYLALAVVGLCLTWYHNIQFALSGAEPLDFIRQALASHASSSLTLDVAVAALTFLTWMWHEAGRLGMPGRGWYVILTLFVALAFAFPFFLFMRERRLDAAVRD